MAFPRDNRTWQILQHAREYDYAVGGFCVYNADGVMAVIRAAEQKHSPAIIQLFPWTMHFQGPHFIQYVVQAAHAASVPISVHLDHCIKHSDIELALTYSFDSIMIDGPGSSGDLEASIFSCRRIIQKAKDRGISIEAELGRVDGVEDGVDFGAAVQGMLTEPKDAKAFVQGTSANFLAPSFGNVHGGYGASGPERYWQFERLASIGESLGNVPLVLHGTHEVPNRLLLMAIKCGVRKINLNKTVRDGYTRFMAENAGKLELTKLQEVAVDIYATDIAIMMDILGSSNKA